MSSIKVSQSDIAKALNLSRNTVSKALNGNPVITEKTRRLVIQKALDMGYRNISNEVMDEIGQAGRPAGGSVALLCHEESLGGSSYWNGTIKGIESILSRENYTLTLHIVQPRDVDAEELPPCVKNRNCDGVIIQGVFPASYYRKLASFGLPFVSMDIAPELISPHMICDIISTHNTNPVKIIVSSLIEQGHRRIGFIGDIQCCKGFFERWRGYTEALLEMHIPVDESLIAVAPSPGHYFSAAEIAEAVERLHNRVTALVCANDDIALMVIKALRGVNKTVPEDICIAGFDNIEESKILPYTITTVNCDVFELGATAGEQIIWRIRNASRPFRTIKVCSDVILGDSTRKQIR